MAKAKKGKITHLERLQVEYLAVDQLLANEYNPNRQSEHEFELLKKSITDDGMTQPVICLAQPDSNGMFKIVDGEHRWRACKELGFSEIPVVKIDMSEEQRRLSTLRHNMARGTHDVELQAGVLRDLEALGVLGWAQESLQMDEIEVQRLLHDYSPLDAYAQDGFTESWEYDAAGDNPEGQATPNYVSDMAKTLQNLDHVERARLQQQAGMKANDAELVRHNLTFTRQQENILNQATQGQTADAIIAMAEAQLGARRRSGKSDWSTMTFLVPATALPVIEAELERLAKIAPTIQPDLTPELIRGLALEFMAVLSGQTPEESIK